MGTRFNTRKAAEMRYATRHLALEKNKRLNQSKDIAPLKACKQLLKSDDWDKSKFSLIPKNSSKKLMESKNSSVKDLKSKYLGRKNREKVVIVSKKSSSVRVVKSGSQRSLKGIQKSVSVKKVSYSTSVIVSSGDDEDDESDSEEDDDCEDDDSDYDEDEKSKASSHKRGTVIKHTTSKIKTNYCNTKKTDNRASKKAKALKLLREKSSTKKKSNALSNRELRPRFPYSPTQEWPTARAHRMASLNALAKVHVLYENEGRTTGENEENSSSEILSDVSSNDSKCSVKEAKCILNTKDKETSKSSKDNKTSEGESKTKRTRKRKHAADVEIIDTRICKRMASLNAQAILAASYVKEKTKKREKIKKVDKPQSSPETDVEFKEIILESSCNLQICDSDKDQSSLHIDSSSQESLTNNDILLEKNHALKKHKEEIESKNIDLQKNIHCFKTQDEESSELSPIENQKNITSPRSDAPSFTNAETAVSEVGVTQYTQVTKVQINTTKEMAVKEENKAERKIESILEKDDVAITRMYHYQSNSSSQSYSVRMETTYKPMSRNYNSSSSYQRSGPIPSPHVMGAVMPTRQSYYSYHNRPGVLASQAYPMNRNVSNLQPVVGVDPRMTDQYGNSAFSVPQYGHPPHMAYPRNEYGYYQPAGPLIQPNHDQYTIHKPVPFHPHPPTQLHSTQTSMTTPSTSGRSRDPYPPTADGFPSRHSVSSNSDIKPKPIPQKSELTSSPHRSSHHISSSQSSKLNSQGVATAVSSHRTGSQVCDSRPHTNVLPHMHGQYPHEKVENYNKYSLHSNQTLRSQDHGSYTAISHRDRPICSSNQHGSSYHMKSNIPQTVSNFNQYMTPTSTQQHHSKCVPKLEPTKSSEKYHRSERDVSHYKNNSGHYSKDSDMNSSSGRSSKLRNLWRPPVVDVEKECESRNTKTYIELDVPKACPREKIVVVDVEKEEMKEQNIKKCNPITLPTFSSPLQEKTIEQPDIIEIGSSKSSSKANVRELRSKSEISGDSSSDSPDILVIGMKKKEPSALIRRAKLHGKQRTYRDSENRPLAPYSNLKKAVTTLDAPFDHTSSIFQPQVSISRLVLPATFESKLRHGWTWDGKPSEKLVYVRNDDPPFLRLCYPGIRHHEGDIIKVRDCVLLKSGARKTDLPFIAKVTALWENPTDGEMMMSLLWYYRPEHTEPGRKPFHVEGEIFASKHRDTNSVACIEDKCYVLTSGEYFRYRRHCKMLESTCQSPVSVVPPIDDYPRKDKLPPSCISPEMVFFCRKVYDFRQKRILKNPM